MVTHNIIIPGPELIPIWRAMGDWSVIKSVRLPMSPVERGGKGEVG